MRFRMARVRRWAWKAIIPAVCLAAAGQLAFAGTAAAYRVTSAQHVTGSIKPGTGLNLLDCNVTSIKRICTDPHGPLYDGHFARFRDPRTHAYVGHDEPSVKFISTTAGSGNTMSYYMQLPTDPATAPTSSGSVTDYGQLSVAPWFGLPMCDPKSYPQNPCTSDSDTNSGLISNPAAAGSAFMELQFYPPGFTPFVDSVSCSKTRWCSALTIDSLECTFNFATCNNNCIEPVNFAFLQLNGVPAGPPAPQNPNSATFLGNSKTLKMKPGDVLHVSISDPAAGFTATVTDMTTGQTGTMVASAANGFANTSMTNCGGTPFTFHAEYSSASQRNQVPWAALEGGVLMEQEIGHGEVCSSVSNKDGFSAIFSATSSYLDPNVFQNCVGGGEGSTSKGEGPCSTTTGTCSHATTQGTTGPKACPVNNPSSGALCEFADGFCFQSGTRAVTINGVASTESMRANMCYQGQFQNGDLDFDGLSYHADWPNGSSSFPTSIRYAGPFMAGGGTYPSVQFETDAAGSENLCNVATGQGCTAPPISAKFYPFWSLTNKQGITGVTTPEACTWNFGNVISGVTVSSLGKDAQYGTPDVARYGGTLTSAVRANPSLKTTC